MKYRIYIDEVGNSDLKSSQDKNHRYLSLTGVIFNLDYVKSVLSPELEKLKMQYFGSHPDEPIILHRKEMINKKYPFKILKNQDIEQAFNADLLGKLRNWEYSIITVAIDKYEHEQHYTTWKYDPYHYCLAVLIERYYRFLADQYAHGDIMIESRGGNEDIRLKKSFNKIMNEGTNFIKSEDFRKVFTSHELKVKPKTANISGLQIADLLAYPSRTLLFEMFSIDKKKTVTFNDRINEAIQDKYYNKKGRIQGWGIKLLP